MKMILILLLKNFSCAENLSDEDLAIASSNLKAQIPYKGRNSIYYKFNLFVSD